jgi:hypothetical protein
MERLRKSIGEITKHIECPFPTRNRKDDKVVELFLHAWQGGRFAARLRWLPQNTTNVEVIASDPEGVRLAIEHTRVFAFEGHQLEEALLRPIATRLEAEPGLDLPDRRFDVHFYPGFANGLPRRLRQTFSDQLARWVVSLLPSLAVRPEIYRLPVPALLPKAPSFILDVTVSDRHESVRPISVGGWLPSGQRLTASVEKALETKLPKLKAALADYRILLVDIPTFDGQGQAIQEIGNLSAAFPTLGEVSNIVIAETVGLEVYRSARFFAYDTVGYDLVEVIHATFPSITTAGR